MTSSSSFRVLIIEDDPQLRAIIEALLSDEGYAVQAAESGERAIEISRDHRFDLIVADIRMPGIDGLDTLELLRSTDPTLQSLVMTGYASEEDPIRALHIGVQAYLRKPFSLDDFLARVRQLSQRSREQQRQREALEGLGGSLNWALRHCMSSGLRTTNRTISELMDLVHRLATKVGLDLAERGLTWLESAALVACLRKYGLQGALPDAEPHWPEAVESILSALEERYDGQGVPDGLRGDAIPIGSRLVAVALAAWQGSLQAGDARVLRLEDLDPGRFDPTLLEALAQAHGAAAAKEFSAQRLLPLASILLENGAYRQVREIYSEVLSGSNIARERMEAWLGLTRVALAQGGIDEALHCARQVMEGSEAVGPLSRGHCYMQLGVMLCSRQLSAGVDCFNRARTLFAAVRYAAGQTEASLALAHFDNQILETTSQELLQYIQADQPAHWLRNTAWLLPCLLDRCGDEKVIRRVVRLVDRHFPGTLKRLSGAASLSAVAQHRLKHCLETLAQSEPEAEGESAPPPLQCYSLLNFEVFCKGRRLDERLWPTAKVKYLLARLVLEPERPISEDALIDDFWAGELEKGRRNLGWSLTQLRKILREQIGDLASVVRRGNAVILTFPPTAGQVPLWHDCLELEKLLHQAETSKVLSAELCAAILGLYRGPFMPSCYMEWANQYRNRLQLRLTQWLTGAMQASDQLPEPLRAEVAHRLLDFDPCHQLACAELMSQSLNSGRPEEALRRFKKIQARLRSDLGMEPDLKLLELSYRAEIGLSHSAGPARSS